MRASALHATFAAAVLAVLLPGAAAAQLRLTSPGGRVFAFDASGALVSSGRTLLYGPGYALRVNGTAYAPAGSPTTSADGRTATYPDAPVGSLVVRRIVYVPRTGTHDYARLLDVVSNPGGAPATATVTLETTLNPYGFGSMVGTSSSGDADVTPEDEWFDVRPGSFVDTTSPLVAAVVQGASGRVRTTVETAGRGAGPLGADGAVWQFELTLPPGGRAAILTFALESSAGNEAALLADAAAVVATPDDTLVGLDAYADAIVNFQSDTPGAPLIRFTSPPSATEGDPIPVTVAVTDPGGATPSWTWDLDGDGTFGDTPGASDATIPAGTTDGPGYARVGVEATNGTATARRYANIHVTNVPPRITSPAPPGATSIDGTYGVAITASDPAGARDPLHFVCTQCPGTMAVGPDDGFVSWTPTSTDLTRPGMPDAVVVTVDDGDGGSAVLSFDLVVVDDHVPSRPTTLYPSGIVVAELAPRLVAGNATDADGDALTYDFELDVVGTFDSPAKRVSPPVPQTDGFTAWRLSPPLESGTEYHWRVRASDGVLDGEWVETSFFTEAPRGEPDAGAVFDGDLASADAGSGGPSRRGGCAVDAGAQRSGAPVAWALVLAALVRRRATRRTSRRAPPSRRA